LFRAIVNARSAQDAEQISDGADHLLVRGPVAETARLPEGVMVINKGHQVTTQFSAVQGAVTLRLEAVK